VDVARSTGAPINQNRRRVQSPESGVGIAIAIGVGGEAGWQRRGVGVGGRGAKEMSLT